MDGTSGHPFILEVFSSSQPEIFNRICPSKLTYLLLSTNCCQSKHFHSVGVLISCTVTYLVCTQMRVCHVEGLLPYLTSSFETETFITGLRSCNNKQLVVWLRQVSCVLSVTTTGYHKGQPYVSDPKVKGFIQWTKTLKDNVVLQRTAVSGHYCYPHPPQKCTQQMADSSSKRKTQTGSFKNVFWILEHICTLKV